MERSIAPALIESIAREYGFHVRAASSVEPSDEAVAWRADAEMALFIHQSPQWRTREELTWVHELLGRVARDLPDAVAPLTTRRGATFVEHDGSLFTT